ncbi:MAG: hypothetical protein K6E20_01380 [Acholeplasmatales bacterium]|nr:hypothetical protein [Acholeplasmatales bacterium]
MKKKVKLILVLIILFWLVVFCIPIPKTHKDGGTKDYNAVLYQVRIYQRLSVDEDSGQEGYIRGKRIRILGIVVYKNTYFE